MRNNQQPQESNKVFLACLSSTLTKKELSQNLSNFNSITNIELPLESNGRNKSMAILHLSSEKEFQSIIERGSVEIEGRLVKAHEYLQGEKLLAHKKKLSKKRVYLKNIPKSISEQDLEKALECFGPVLEAYRIKIRNKKTTPANYGFAEFTKEENAIKAIKAKWLYFANQKKAHILPYKPQNSQSYNKRESKKKKKNNQITTNNKLNFNQNETRYPSGRPRKYKNPKNMNKFDVNFQNNNSINLEKKAHSEELYLRKHKLGLMRTKSDMSRDSQNKNPNNENASFYLDVHQSSSKNNENNFKTSRNMGIKIEDEKEERFPQYFSTELYPIYYYSNNNPRQTIGVEQNQSNKQNNHQNMRRTNLHDIISTQNYQNYYENMWNQNPSFYQYFYPEAYRNMIFYYEGETKTSIHDHTEGNLRFNFYEDN